VTVVICFLVALPATGFARADAGAGALLRRAAQLSGLPARRPVPTATASGVRYDSLLARARDRGYSLALQRVDARLYDRLGLTTRSLRARASAPRVWYDPAAHRLLLRRTPRPGRVRVIHELVRALIDQNYRLSRLRGLRTRDRDRALAANAIVDGTASLASGVRAGALRGTPLDRFLQLENEAGLGPGRALAADLRYLGGAPALASALRTFPQTTEQLLHVDKFLERERAVPVSVLARIGDVKLSAAQTFGELAIRNLLRAVGVPNSAGVAAGWGGGRLALYVSGQGDAIAALVVRWDTPEDAAEWRNAVPRYVAAAFGDPQGHDCPPVDRCWTATTELAAGSLGGTSVLVSGPGAAEVAAKLLSNPQVEP
jgi:hypothetical protein